MTAPTVSSHTRGVVSSTLDPRWTAYLSDACPEAFHSNATPTALWQPDTFDVETIHADARTEFESLLHRAAAVPLPPSGFVLVLKGVSGCGKTHLLRAFRTLAHREGRGYCGYVSMNAETDNYPRYILAAAIEALDQNYTFDEPAVSGLSRLSAGLLDLTPGVSGAEREAFRGGGDMSELVDEYADRLRATPRFAQCDLEVLRAFLHLQRNDSNVRTRALMWLRCQEMKAKDRRWIGDAVPRADDAAPTRMLIELARLMDAVHGVPLVLLVDELELMQNQTLPTERFLKLVDALTALTDHAANVVVVMACLEDYFQEHVKLLTKSKQDRLCRNPEEIRLSSNRSLDEIHDMVGKRLARLFQAAKTHPDPNDPLFPFRPEHLKQFRNFRPRDILYHLHEHREACRDVGKPLDPGIWKVKDDKGKAGDEQIVTHPLAPLWNALAPQYDATAVPDEPDELAAVLATALGQLEPELPDGHHYGTDASDRYVQVEGHAPNNAIDKLLVAVCLKSAKGGGLAAELRQVAKRAGEIPVAIVRTTDFPKSGQTLADLNELLGTSGRRVQVENTDWRRMLAFDAFRKQHATRSDFDMWQKQAKPLTGLASLQKILKLGQLASPVVVPSAPTEPAPVPPPPLVPPPPIAQPSAVGASPLVPPVVPEWAETMAKKAADFLRKKGRPVQPAGVIVGPTFVRLKLEPRGDPDFNKVRREAVNLKVELKLEKEPLILSQPGYYSIDVLRPDRETVFLTPLLASAPAKLAGEPAFPVGVGVDGAVEWLNLSDSEACHLLVAGATGSGKSVFLKSVLVALAARLDPDQVRFQLIDPKRVTFNVPSACPYLVGPVVSNPDDVVPVLEGCADEMERRYVLLERHGLEHVRELTGRDAVHRLVVVMDEFANLMLDKTTRRELEPLLIRLATKARAAGIHLILGTQRPDNTVMPMQVRSNLPGKIGLRVDKESESELFLDDPGAAYLFGDGDLVFKRGGGLVRLQSPFVSKADFDRLLRVV